MRVIYYSLSASTKIHLDVTNAESMRIFKTGFQEAINGALLRLHYISLHVAANALYLTFYRVSRTLVKNCCIARSSSLPLSGQHRNSATVNHYLNVNSIYIVNELARSVTQTLPKLRNWKTMSEVICFD